ncbi:dockerin type I repeat-containing protein [Erysipelothrix anatis]|uniref:dockerin type I repeat-containing protein n=1 Tax=Erysipelothrix anatis TaxID=2683713 RepID=UPI00140B9227|nr:dockerin type I repeat-containing protein [Erysipelothrix anatis]
MKQKTGSNVLLFIIALFMLGIIGELKTINSMPLPNTLVGDVNGDEILNISDLAMVKSHLMGVRRLKKEDYLRADINKDGIVDATDMELVRIIIQRRLGVSND